MVDSVTRLAQQTLTANADAEQAKITAANAILQKNAKTSEITPDLIATRVTARADGTLVITTAAGNERTVNKDDEELFNNKKKENLALKEEERNKLEAFKAWAAENTPYSANYLDNIQTTGDLLRDPRFNDFGNYISAVQQKTGRPPYNVPYTQLKEIENLAAISPRSPFATNSGAGFQFATLDNVLPTGGAVLASTELAALKRATTKQVIQTTTSYQTGTAEPSVVLAAKLIAQKAASLVRREEVEVNGKDESRSSLTGEDGLYTQSRDVDSQASAPEVDENNKNNARPNPLDQYTSYTYSLSLHVLNTAEYNAMVESNGQSVNFSNTLIAGAGRWASSGDAGLKRSPGWEDNFFFDNLKFTSVIGLNSQSRGTNVVNLDFTIIEPMGLSLMDRLLATTKELSNEVYFASCYVIQIDFFDSEAGMLADLRKYIPIRFTDMRVKVTARGSEYACSAVPFGHHALLQSQASTPANFEVVAGTLEEFFGADDSESASTAAKAAREGNADTANTQTNAGVLQAITGTRIQPVSAKKAGDQIYSVNSYTSAFNGWYETLVELKVTSLTKPQKIKVIFDKEILKDGGGQIYRPRNESGQIGAGGMVNPDNPRTNGDEVQSQKDRDKFSLSAGTLVTEVINTAMMNSEFIRRQVQIPEDKKEGAQQKEGFFRWWKTVPSITLLEFDKKNNVWSFETTYYVIPYDTINTTHPHVPKAKPYRAACVKEYQYLYTGQNVAVLDFQVDFDFLYFTRVMALRNKDVDTSYDQGDTPPEGFGTEQKNKDTSGGFNPVVIKHTSDEASATAGRKLRDPIGLTIGNISENLYSSARGEMLNVSMKIIGDPELIKQDDIFTGIVQRVEEQQSADNPSGVQTPSSGYAAAVAFVGNGGQAVTEGTKEGPKKDISKNNNSLIMDTGEVLCWVNLMVPRDMDTRTGGLRNTLKGDLSGFTGVYKILMVDNEFKNGVFTQTLDLIRYQSQPQDYVYSESKRERSAEKDNQPGTRQDGKGEGGGAFDEGGFEGIDLGQDYSKTAERLRQQADEQDIQLALQDPNATGDDVIEKLYNARYRDIPVDSLPESQSGTDGVVVTPVANPNQIQATTI